ncbi:hypothetical protein [Flavobacterium sp. I3-2]|uniref:hypothetical protein n=1 Tax=Flavobacterium sp. I3-2 TaxID=2748319 RepID=UPI0015AC6A86|nr:hypothetical protein [Flavobacterium sp. I3-2]
MGNRSYLFLTEQKESICLFEANNSLPFFWISLLDLDILNQTFLKWNKIETHEEEIFKKDADDAAYNSILCVIDKQNFDKNSERTKSFLEKHFPEIIPLYEDFVFYLNSKYQENKKIEIDFTEYVNFYDSISELKEELQNEIKAIENDNPNAIQFLDKNDLIATGSGYENYNNSEFREFPNYNKLLIRKSTSKVVAPKKINFIKVLGTLAILILCPVFLVIIYKMWRDLGFNSTILILAISNIGFYVYSIWSILEIFKSIKGKK